MGAYHHWLRRRTHKKTSASHSHEWEMKNLSSTTTTTTDTSTDDKKRHQKSGNDIGGDEEDEPARCEWDLTLRTVVSSRASAAASSSDALGVVELNTSEELIATGGIARKIRLYRSRDLISGENADVAALEHSESYSLCICTPAKLSSLRWRPDSGDRVLCSGDYDGVVTEYDLEKCVPIFERDEHGGRRVWSVDYSRWDQSATLAASGSDDGTVQMWDPRSGSGDSVASIRPSGPNRSSPVCCVEFSPFSGPILAVGCADRRAYAYDVRNLSQPILTLDGHLKTVSYVRFLDHHTLVSAGTDGCLKLWDLDDPRAVAVRSYRGHVNSRSFVGLSVWRRGGLLGCGSESNQVFVYDKRWAEPIWVHGFGLDSGFVSTVCWSQVGEDHCTLFAGGSDGALKVFVGHRKIARSSS